MAKWWRQYQSTIPERQLGPWRVKRFRVTRQDEMLQRLANPERYAPVGRYTGLWRDHELWMSDVPQEIEDAVPFMEAARGRVLMSGLGLGVVAAALLRKPEVERLDVVELDPLVLELIGPHLEDPRLHLHQGDALTLELPGEWDYAWHDIWPTIGETNLPDMDLLRERYQGRVTHTYQWCEEACRSYGRVLGRVRLGVRPESLTREEAAALRQDLRMAHLEWMWYAVLPGTVRRKLERKQATARAKKLR